MSRFALWFTLFVIAAAADTATAQDYIGPIFNDQGVIRKNQRSNNTIEESVRAQFTDKIKSEILQKFPKGTVQLQTVGGEADQAIGNEVEQFLVQNGYTVQRLMMGTRAPPPSAPWGASITGNFTVFVVAPSAIKSSSTSR